MNQILLNTKNQPQYHPLYIPAYAPYHWYEHSQVHLPFHKESQHVKFPYEIIPFQFLALKIQCSTFLWHKYKYDSLHRFGYSIFVLSHLLKTYKYGTFSQPISFNVSSQT